MSDFRVNIKVRNARLLRAIEQVGHQPGQKFARLVGISYGDRLLPYINLKRTPFDENGDLRLCAEKLCVFFNCMPDELWSEEQRYPLTTNSTEVELSGTEVQEMLECPMDRITDPGALLERSEAFDAIDDLLDSLQHREAMVLRMRFGIGCEPMTLQETARVVGCSPAWTRKIETRALMNLRYQDRRAESVAASLGIIGEAP